MLTSNAPPLAAQFEHSEVRHGVVVVDEFSWLREKANPQVLEYLEAENAYTAKMTRHLRPLRDALYREMLGRIKQTDLSLPTPLRGYLYYSRTVEGKQYPLQCRRKDSDRAPEEILLDLNNIGKGQRFVSLGHFVVTDDHNVLAYTIDFSGFRRFKLRLQDLRTAELLLDTIENVTSLAWANDNKTLFFVTEDPATKRSDTLWRHTLGSTKALEIYREIDDAFDIHIYKTRDHTYLLMQSDAKDTSETWYLKADQPEGPLVVFLPRQSGHRYSLDHREGLFYILTNTCGRNCAVMTAPSNASALGNWEVFVAHQEHHRIRSISVFRDFAAIVERGRALDRLRVYNFKRGVWKDIVYSEGVYSVSPVAMADYESRTYRYKYQSMVTPTTIFDYDVESGKSTARKQQEVLDGYDPRQYTTERLWATARDGTKIPLSVVYRNGFVQNGKASLILYGYGSYGLGTSPTFSSNRLSLLNRGVACAIAHIRGGDEMGEQWREDGMRMKKKNTFTDFIDCAEYLIEQQWTSKDRLLIEGRSAGGLLIGVVVNMRPDLFKGVHAAVPFVDVLNTMMDATLPLTTHEYREWGNPNEKAVYDYIRTYSPYDNIKRGGYPAMLVTTYLNDSQVMYWEPAKYVARLRKLKTDSNELLLKVTMGSAGHSGASGRYDRLRDIAFEYAWLLSQAGIAA